MLKARPKQAQSVPVQFEYKRLNGLCCKVIWKKSLLGSTQLALLWIAIMILYVKSIQKICIFWEFLIFCLPEPDPSRLCCIYMWKCKFVEINTAVTGRLFLKRCERKKGDKILSLLSWNLSKCLNRIGFWDDTNNSLSIFGISRYLMNSCFIGNDKENYQYLWCINNSWPTWHSKGSVWFIMYDETIFKNVVPFQSFIEKRR